MNLFTAHIADFGSNFGMDTISLAGPLLNKLRAVREAGFSQIMLSARDIVGHEVGVDAAVREVRESGLRVTGFQVLRDFEGLSGAIIASRSSMTTINKCRSNAWPRALIALPCG